VKRQRYPKAGDTNPVPSVRVVSIRAPRSSARVMKLAPGSEYVLPEFSWTRDANSVAVMTFNRAQNELSVWLWQPARGTPRRILFEKAERWVNVFEPPRFLKDGQRFLWASERDGWYHCYLYTREGQQVQQLTRGPWQIEPELSQSWSGGPYEVDRANEWVYFSANPTDPRERQICRVQLDGTHLERLTREPGTHFQKLSPDGRHLLETFSSKDQPPAIRLLRSDGTLVATLEQRQDRWKNYASATIEFHKVTAPDGVTLYAQLTKPADFDPAKKYPVVVHVYGGPHAQLVLNQWPPVSLRHQLLAQEGFLIWSLDNRGSWGRGHAWETAIYKNLGTNELSDQLAGVAYLKALPFVDANRVGVWGWSYGGYMTLYSLTHAPEVFKAGVAGAPVTDWKYYDTIYTERYMGTPQENPAGYKSSSPLAAAGKLQAKLLLIHGTSDDNVHMQNTLNFVDALIKADRPYELQIQPGQSHGFGGEAANRFVAEQLVEFFKRTLKEAP
jgi:dipeptidyl-peptidase-4